MTAESQPDTAAGLISSALAWRYATKTFDPARPVTSDQLGLILESIRMAPTSNGLQPFRVVVVSDRAVKAALRKAAFGQPQVESAPHVLVFVACKNSDANARKAIEDMRRSGAPAESIALRKKYIGLGKLMRTLTFTHRSWAAEQAHIALGFALLAAAQLRVDACPMGGFQAGKVARVLGLASGEVPAVLMALGNRAADDCIRAKYRLPLEELVSWR